MAAVIVDSATGLRADFHEATGRLLIAGPAFFGIGTLEQMERIERFIRQARHQVRADAYEGKWPAPPALPPEF
ncbi:hypothetical protein [Ancylobacter sp. IITR112]|uniref:hypothetical protein n=1 Tax=Ancylobacter sp. IITR112 TaxID=3138073 RepID=UPI00352B9B1F